MKKYVEELAEAEAQLKLVEQGKKPSEEGKILIGKLSMLRFINSIK
jgi:hypothetical protein